MSVLQRRLLVALLAASLSAAIAVADVFAQQVARTIPDDGLATAPANAAEAKIRAALNKTCKIAYYNAPLGLVVRDLAAMYAMNIHIDAKSIDAVGIGDDTPVTLTVNNVSLKSALGLMLDQLELTWMIRHETLLITTPEVAEANLHTRVYNVRDLVVQFDAGAESILDDPQSEAVDFESLIELITTTVAPDTWDEVGGPGAIDGYHNGLSCALVISQTDLVHDEIDKLLVDLREVERETNRTAGSTNGGKQSKEHRQPQITVAVYPIIEGNGPSLEDLVELVREVVGQDKWSDESGTAVRGIAKTLVVRHNQSVHRQVQQTLQKIGVLDSSIYPLGPYYSPR